MFLVDLKLKKKKELIPLIAEMLAEVVLIPEGEIPVNSTVSPTEKSENVPSGINTTVVVPVVIPTIL